MLIDVAQRSTIIRSRRRQRAEMPMSGRERSSQLRPLVGLWTWRCWSRRIARYEEAAIRLLDAALRDVGGVDQHGQVVDVMVSTRRNADAARAFFARALRHAAAPVEVTTDKAPAYPRVIDEIAPAALHVTDRYANNTVEATRDD